MAEDKKVVFPEFRSKDESVEKCDSRTMTWLGGRVRSSKGNFECINLDDGSVIETFRTLKFALQFFQEPIPPERQAAELKADVDLLVHQPPAERMFLLPDHAKRHGLAEIELREMVEAVIKDNEKKEREDKIAAERAEQRAEKKAEKAEKQAEKKQQTDRREQDRKQAREDREKRRAQQEADKEAERTREDREKALAAIVKLPVAEHEKQLAELARRSGEDLAFLRGEFSALLEFETSLPDAGLIEPWPEPVDVKTLLAAVIAQMRRYIVMSDDVAMAVSLWTMFAWVHDVAVYSPLLILTSVEIGSGKSTLLNTIKFLTPRPYHVVEITGPGLFYIIDRKQPTLFIENADKWFLRRPDGKEIINASWTREGAKVPRRVGKTWYDYNVWCPKAIDMVGLPPNDVASRSIICPMVPKVSTEVVEKFFYKDDETFLELRRKLLRFSQDNLAVLKDARPIQPLGLSNRPAANWELLFAIADLAGEGKRARKAAMNLSRNPYEPSARVQLVAAFRKMFGARDMITAEDVVTALLANPDDAIWHEYRGRAPITKFQVAALLKPLGIRSVTLHPTKRSNLTRAGYRREQFEEVFKRFLPPEVKHSNTLKPKRGKKSSV